MDVFQLKRQIVFLAVALLWGDAPQAPVYTGGAVVSEDLEGNFSPGSFLTDGPGVKALPFARVSCEGLQFDEEVPSRIDVARLLLWSTAGGGTPFPGNTAVDPPGFDTHGINMENGSLRDAAQPQGKSTGRSVDELVGRFLEALSPPCQFVDSVHGFQGRCSRADRMVPVNGVTVLKRSLEIEVYNATASRHYHAPQGVKALVVGAAVNLSWRNPPTRFDTYKNEVWRGQNSGDTAPTTRNGHQVALAGNLDTSVSENPGAGTWNYSIFHVYSEVQQGDRQSAGTPFNTVVV